MGDLRAGRLTPDLLPLSCWKNEAATNHPGKRGDGGAGLQEDGKLRCGTGPKLSELLGHSEMAGIQVLS